VACGEKPDPFLVAHELLMSAWAAGGGQPTDVATRLAAAERLAELAQLKLINRGLKSLVARWRRGSKKDLERIRRLYRGYDALREWNEAQSASRVVEQGPDLKNEDPGAGAAVALVLVHGERARAYESLGRLAEARNHHEQAVALARKIGWWSAYVNFVGRIAFTHYRETRYDSALATIERMRDLAPEMEERSPFWLALSCFCRLGQGDRAAAALLHALEKPDGATEEPPAGGRSADPFLLVDALLCREGEAIAAGDANPERFRAAIERVVSTTADSPACRGLAALVKRFRERSEEDRREAVRRARLAGGIVADFGLEPWNDLIRRAREALQGIESSRVGVAGVRLRVALAALHLAAGHSSEAADEFGSVAKSAAALVWPRLEIEALRQVAGIDALAPDRLQRSLAAWERVLEIEESIGDVGADAYRRVAEAHLRLGRHDRAEENLIKEFRLYRNRTAAEKSRAVVCLYNLGLCFLFQGKFRKALGTLERAGKLAEETDSAAQRLRVVNAKGMCQQHLGDLDRALACHRRALEMAVAQDDVLLEAACVNELGLACLKLERYAEALGHLERARAIQERLGARRAAARTGLNIGVCLQTLGRHEEAMRVLRKCRTELLHFRDQRGAATAIAELGTAYLGLAEFGKASECLHTGYREKLAAGNRYGALITLSQLAELHRKTGNARKALALYREAAKESREGGKHAVYHRRNIGVMLAVLGRYAESLAELEGAYRDAVALGLPQSRLDILGDLGRVYRIIGQVGRARDCLEKVLAGCTRPEQRVLEGRAHQDLARVYLDLGRNDEALESARKALSVFEDLGDRLRIAFARDTMGAVLREQGEDERALECFRTSYRILSDLGLAVEAARELLPIGRVQASQDKYEESLASFRRALEVMKEAGEETQAPDALTGMAEVRRVQARPADAVGLVRRAIEQLGRRGAGLAEEEAIEVNTDIRDAVNVGLLALIEQETASPDPGLHATAFSFLESGRGLVLAERVLNRDALYESQVPAELYQKYRFARARAGELSRKLTGLSAANPRAPAVREVRERLDAAYDTFRQIAADVERTAHRAAEIVRPSPLSLSRFQERLPAGTLFLHYLVTEANTAVLAVTRNRTALHDLGPSAAIQQAVETYLALVGAPGTGKRPAMERKQAARLYERLLGPIESLVRDKRVLLVSPDGILAFLPFEALVGPGNDRPERLIERRQVSYLPSGTVLDLLRTDAAKWTRGTGFVGLGDPTYFDESGEASDATLTRRGAVLRGAGPLSRLPESGVEVRSIGDLFPTKQRTLLLRENASVAGLEKALAGVDGRLACLHLACHGHVDANRPKLTGLFLSGNALLTLADIYRMRLPADLAVLSGCRTNRGAIRRSEGVIGLVRGFFFAGCPRVVVSNWLVSDESTRVLMVRFYRNLLEKGLPAGAALRAAKLEMLRANRGWAYPFHWAAFVLWGLPD